MSQDSLEYQGYRLEVVRMGITHKVFIYAPGARCNEEYVPNAVGPNARTTVVDEAKAYIDRAIAKSN